MRIVLGIGLLLIVIIVVVLILFSQKSKEPVPPNLVPTQKAEENIKGNMKIQSTAFEYNQSIPAKYTCDGENINPPLEFLDIPSNTKSLVLIVDDPDAPSGLWVHWTLWNINPQTKEIPENSVPAGAVQGATNRENKYHGPCPPDREHRYFFKLYALDTALGLNSSSNKSELEQAMEGHIVSSAELIGLYNRQ